ncbi:ankyrin repeat-containing domain protein, partial [Microdochium bolleyi]
MLLEEFKVDPNATGPEYGNALTAAAYDANMEILQLLLAAGADVNSPNGWALQIAAAEGHYGVVEELLKHNADVNACTTNENFPAGTALQGACEASRTEIV